MEGKMLRLLFKLHAQNRLTTQQLCDIITEYNASEVAQQLPLPLNEITRHNLDIQQHQEIVDMRVNGADFVFIADVMNGNHHLNLTPDAIKTLMKRLENGEKLGLRTYQSPEWQTALKKWMAQLKAAKVKV
jgi:hypothetical protein